MARLPIPPARPVLHPLRPLASATTVTRRLPGHRVRLTIDHRPLAGITPEMLLWWFSNLGGTMAYAGEEVPRYLVWHPVDHILWQLARPAPGGGAAEGARFRIVEAFGADPAHYIDTVERVEKLDLSGIRLVRRVAGVKVFQLEHTWSRCGHGTHYVSVMEVGARFRALAPLNRYLTGRVFGPRTQQAWLRHNVEEVGLLEHLLPGLYPGSPSTDVPR